MIILSWGSFFNRDKGHTKKSQALKNDTLSKFTRKSEGFLALYHRRKPAKNEKFTDLLIIGTDGNKFVAK
jgi:hypothetical protein